MYDKGYLIISIKDISEIKQKELLERIFFHDILNIAGSLSGILQLYPMFSKEEKLEYEPVLRSLTDEIIDEIKAQRQMIQAELGELTIEPTDIESDQLVQSVHDKIRFHQVSFEKNIEVQNNDVSSLIYTDEVLLTRILINMAKNALEAIDQGETISISSERCNGHIRFSVHNHTYIPIATQLQIFKRSFSTKGKSRGLGTYSMKMLGEKFLKGRVDFISTEKDGTTFFIELPAKS